MLNLLQEDVSNIHNYNNDLIDNVNNEKEQDPSIPNSSEDFQCEECTKSFDKMQISRIFRSLICKAYLAFN